MATQAGYTFIYGICWPLLNSVFKLLKRKKVPNILACPWLFSNFDDVDDSPSGNKDTHAAHLKQFQTKQLLTVSRDGCHHQYSGLSIRDWERTRANISSLIFFFFFLNRVRTMDI